MRQPQRVHKPFHRLNIHDRFFIGSKEFWKVGFCRYQQINKAAHTAEEWGKQTRIRFISPWTVVRSAEFVNKKITPTQLALLNESACLRNEKNKRILAKYNNHPPYTEAELLNSGKTHYVGDDCPGGHGVGVCNVAIGAQALASETAGVENHEISRVEQPNSDNGVKGPTS